MIMKLKLRNALLCYFVHLVAKISAEEIVNTGIVTAVEKIDTVVHFDPCVSILDADNHFRYDVSNLIPLVGKVATRFKKLLVQQTEIDCEFDTPTSLSLSPLAAARYNRMMAGTNKTVEVWLSHRCDLPDCIYDPAEFRFYKSPSLLIDRMVSIAKEANAVFDNTVSTILLPYGLLLNDMELIIDKNKSVDTILSTVVQNWGLVVDPTTLRSYPSFREHIAKLRPAIIVLRLRSLPPNCDYYNCFRSGLDLLSRLPDDVKRAWIVSVPDTYPSGNVNTTGQVTAWNLSMSLSKSHGLTNIISKAFDTPCSVTVQKKTSGWWRLVENSSYVTTSDFVFEEKIQIFRPVVENEERLTLRKPDNLIINSSNVEIIFNLYNKTRDDPRDIIPPEVVDRLVGKIVEKFSSVVILLHHDSRQAYTVLRDELSAIGRLPEEQVNVTMVLMPKVRLSRMIKPYGQGFNESKQSYRQLVKPITTFVVPYIGNETALCASRLKRTLLDGMGVVRNVYNFGYAFNISTCSSFDRMSDDERELVTDYLTNKGAETIIFYFEETIQNVMLGAERLLRQRIVVLEQCRKLCPSGRLGKVELKFMMLHYATSSGFYTNMREFTSFTEYLQKLSHWAATSKSKIILSNAIDGYRYFKQRRQLVTEVGWWRYHNTTDGSTGAWLDKVDDFELKFQNSEDAFTQSVLKAHEIALIVMLPLICAFTCTTYAYFHMKRNFKEAHLSKKEINGFFKGEHTTRSLNQIASAKVLPYDKSRYEIDSEKFTIDTDCVLGSGEFGQVTKGTLLKDGKLVNVAVKTVNPTKVKKTTLTGLLSEIKILSFIGRHDNIIELLGANTRNIRNENVFVFLELCELGSLEAYLRRKRLAYDNVYDNIVEVMDWEPNASAADYVNPITRSGELDEAVREDMYRWSYEICSGMEYLASKHVVHADLATRNVLLNSDRIAKICDFGLARRMYNYKNYAKTEQEPLPWKWMSPESLRFLEFNESSDVWAYGVTLWEIYSLGENPYPGISWDLHFVDMLTEGLRLEEPRFNNQNMYTVMLECWQLIPELRPSFKKLLAIFRDMELYAECPISQRL